MRCVALSIFEKLISSTAEDEYTYNIRNEKDPDSYIVVRSAPTPGKPVLLYSSKTEKPSNFKFYDDEWQCHRIAVIIDGKEYPVAASLGYNNAGTECVMAYSDLDEAKASPHEALWNIQDNQDGTFLMNTGSVSWYSDSSFGNSIGLKYNIDGGYPETRWNLVNTNSEENKRVSMYYTLDGTEPTVENGTLYTDTIFLTENCTPDRI